MAACHSNETQARDRPIHIYRQALCIFDSSIGSCVRPVLRNQGYCMPTGMLIKMQCLPVRRAKSVKRNSAGARARVCDMAKLSRGATGSETEVTEHPPASPIDFSHWNSNHGRRGFICMARNNVCTHNCTERYFDFA